MVISRREMVKAASVLALAGVGLFGTGSARADVIDEDPINARFNQIFQTYEVGDILSPEDAAFVEEYGRSSGAVQARDSDVFNGSRTVNGVTYYVRGNWYDDDAGDTLAWHNYGATVQGGSASAVSQQITVIMCYMAYGLVGASYQVIHKDEKTNTDYGVNWNAADFAGSYWGVFVSSSMSCYAEIKPYSGSTFRVQ